MQERLQISRISSTQKSCKPFKREIKARLNNVPNFGPNKLEETIPEDTEDMAYLENMLADEVQVCLDVLCHHI